MPVFNPSLSKPTGNLLIDVSRVADLGAYPITLAEAKTQLRVDFTDDDAQITELIQKATRRVENYCNISIVYQRIVCIAQLEDPFLMPYGRVIGLESVMDSSADSGPSGAVQYANTITSWRQDGDYFYPSGCTRWKLQYTAGMTTVPEDLKDVILQVLVFLYENRGKNVSTYRKAGQDSEGNAIVTDLQSLLTNANNYLVPWI